VETMATTVEDAEVAATLEDRPDMEKNDQPIMSQRKSLASLIHSKMEMGRQLPETEAVSENEIGGDSTPNLKDENPSTPDRKSLDKDIIKEARDKAKELAGKVSRKRSRSSGRRERESGSRRRSGSGRRSRSGGRSKSRRHSSGSRRSSESSFSDEQDLYRERRRSFDPDRGHFRGRGRRSRGGYYDRDHGERGGFRGRGRGFRGRGALGHYEGGGGPHEYYEGGGGDGEDRGRGGRGRGRGRYIARGRNIFPEDQRGRGRGQRVNQLFLRFQQQHRDQYKDPNDDALDGYGEKKGRDSSTSSSSSSSDSSPTRAKGKKKKKKRSSDSDSSDSSRERKKKKKGKKKKKKGKKIKKEKVEGKKIKKEKEDPIDDEGLNWRVDMIEKMKDIKSMSPNRLEIEFKKAMAERKRKEEEEACIKEIKDRQKTARKVKKENEKKDKKSGKKIKTEPTGAGEQQDYFVFMQQMKQLEEDEAEMKREMEQEQINHFRSSFAEVPFVPEDSENANAAPAEDGTNPTPVPATGPDSPTPEESTVDKLEAGKDASWPAGALEEPEFDETREEGGMTKEEVDAEQAAQETAWDATVEMDPKLKHLVATSKIFSKVRSNLKKRPLKINLKTTRMSMEDEDEEGGDEPGLHTGGENTPAGEMTPLNITPPPRDDRGPTPGLEQVSEAEDEKDYEGGEEKYKPGGYGGGYDYEYDENGEEYNYEDNYYLDSYHEPEEERAKWEKLYEKEKKEKTYKNIYQSRRNSEKHVEEEAEEGEHSPSPSPIPWKQHREKRPKRHSRRNTFHDESENKDDPDNAMEEGEIRNVVKSHKTDIKIDHPSAGANWEPAVSSRPSPAPKAIDASMTDQQHKDVLKLYYKQQELGQHQSVAAGKTPLYQQPPPLTPHITSKPVRNSSLPPPTTPDYGHQAQSRTSAFQPVQSQFPPTYPPAAASTYTAPSYHPPANAAYPPQYPPTTPTYPPTTPAAYPPTTYPPTTPTAYPPIVQSTYPPTYPVPEQSYPTNPTYPTPVPANSPYLTPTPSYPETQHTANLYPPTTPTFQSVTAPLTYPPLQPTPGQPMSPASKPLKRRSAVPPISPSALRPIPRAAEDTSPPHKQKRTPQYPIPLATSPTYHRKSKSSASSPSFRDNSHSPSPPPRLYDAYSNTPPASARRPDAPTSPVIKMEYSPTQYADAPKQKMDYDKYLPENSNYFVEKDLAQLDKVRKRSGEFKIKVEPEVEVKDELIDLTEVSPIMKFIAKKLEDGAYPLELSGPFRYKENTPGLTKYLFVAYKMVRLLETAGYDGNKMYMAAMFPTGMKTLKTDLSTLVFRGKLDPRIKGSKLSKMAIRSIKCFIAYYTGKQDDLEMSDEGECSEEDEGELPETDTKKGSRTVPMSIMDALKIVKESKRDDEIRNMTEDMDEAVEVPVTEYPPRKSAGRSKSPPSSISFGGDNPWGAMETKMKSENLQTFTALQSHFFRQLLGGQVEKRKAWAEAQDSTMLFVTASYSDTQLRDMVGRYSGTILPDRPNLDDKREGSERTLFDQIVDKLMMYKKQFPMTFIQEAQAETDWKEALLKKIRDIVRRTLMFYMRGCGKLVEGAGAVPAVASDYQFNYLPEGLREDEKQEKLPAKGKNNFFNINDAAAANRSFSSYTDRRKSLDEPVPESGEVTKGKLPPNRYLFGTLYIDTVVVNGASYVYEMGIHMSDTTSIEVHIVPNKLYRNQKLLEMLGFSYNPDEDKYVCVKPGSGFHPAMGEERGIAKIMKFLHERRFESKGDSKNSGLVLATQTMEDIATWLRFTGHHQREREISEYVCGYGCIDMFVNENKGLYSYTGPTLHREPNQTYFTWEYSRTGHASESMAASKGAALFEIVENLLGGPASYQNFMGVHCFPISSPKSRLVERRFDIIKDMYNLEIFLANALNGRNEKRRLVQEGVFSAKSAAEMGDRPGLVAARMVRLMAEVGLSKLVLKDQVLQAEDRGQEFTIGLQVALERMGNVEVRRNCEDQIRRVTKFVKDYFLRR